MKIPVTLSSKLTGPFASRSWSHIFLCAQARSSSWAVRKSECGRSEHRGSASLIRHRTCWAKKSEIKSRNEKKLLSVRQFSIGFIAFKTCFHIHLSIRHWARKPRGRMSLVKNVIISKTNVLTTNSFIFENHRECFYGLSTRLHNSHVFPRFEHHFETTGKNEGVMSFNQTCGFCAMKPVKWVMTAIVR